MDYSRYGIDPLRVAEILEEQNARIAEERANRPAYVKKAEQAYEDARLETRNRREARAEDDPRWNRWTDYQRSDVRSQYHALAEAAAKAEEAAKQHYVAESNRAAKEARESKEAVAKKVLDDKRAAEQAQRQAEQDAALTDRLRSVYLGSPAEFERDIDSLKAAYYQKQALSQLDVDRAAALARYGGRF
jgi:flagellar biosynthesis GTPase FlhF